MVGSRIIFCFVIMLIVFTVFVRWIFQPRKLTLFSSLPLHTLTSRTTSQVISVESPKSGTNHSKLHKKAWLLIQPFLVRCTDRRSQLIERLFDFAKKHDVLVAIELSSKVDTSNDVIAIPDECNRYLLTLSTSKLTYAHCVDLVNLVREFFPDIESSSFPMENWFAEHQHSYFHYGIDLDADRDKVYFEYKKQTDAIEHHQGKYSVNTYMACRDASVGPFWDLLYFRFDRDGKNNAIYGRPSQTVYVKWKGQLFPVNFIGKSLTSPTYTVYFPLC